jgi:Na+/melibiose symporter-like transporter
MLSIINYNLNINFKNIKHNKNYMNLIKKYLGIVGFLLALIGISIAALYKFNETDMQPLVEISFFVWITTWTISSEINKEKPKKWWVYTVTILSLVAISAMLFVYY